MSNIQKWISTRLRRLAPIAITLSLLVGGTTVLSIVVGIPAAHAVGTYNNATIATDALADVGQDPAPGGGQCKAFANAMVSAASGGAQSPSGYQSGWAAAGGTQVSSANAVEGDIIQITPAGSTDSTAESIYYAHVSDSPPSSAYRLHTTIIVGNNGNNSFTVVDANFQPANGGTVAEHYNFNPYTWAAGSIIDIWRMGTPNGGGGSTPPAETSSSNSGVVVTQSTGFTQVFAEGPGNSLNDSWAIPGSQSWSSGTVPGSSGTTFSAPSAVLTQSSGLTQVFVKGPSNSLEEFWTTGYGQPWSGPAVIAGANTTYSQPAAVVTQSTGFTQVFAEGPSWSLDNYWITPGSQQGWGSATVPGSAGTILSAPSAVVRQLTGFTQVFALGVDAEMQSYWITPGGQQGWGSGVLTGSYDTTFSAPAAVVAESSGLTQVFAEGANNSLISFWIIPGQQLNWSSATLPNAGITFSAPTATLTQTSGLTQVFALGQYAGIESYWITPGGSQGWGSAALPGTNNTFSAPAAVVTQSSGFTQVFAEGAGNDLESYWIIPGQPSWSSAIVPGTTGSIFSAP